MISNALISVLVSKKWCRTNLESSFSKILCHLVSGTIPEALKAEKESTSQRDFDTYIGAELEQALIELSKEPRKESGYKLINHFSRVSKKFNAKNAKFLLESAGILFDTKFFWLLEDFDTDFRGDILTIQTCGEYGYVESLDKEDHTHKFYPLIKRGNVGGISCCVYNTAEEALLHSMISNFSDENRAMHLAGDLIILVRGRGC